MHILCTNQYSIDLNESVPQVLYDATNYPETADSGDLSVQFWTGLTFFKQSATVPASCASCPSSPDWQDQVINTLGHKYGAGSAQLLGS